MKASRASRAAFDTVLKASRGSLKSSPEGLETFLNEASNDPLERLQIVTTALEGLNPSTEIIFTSTLRQLNIRHCLKMFAFQSTHLVRYHSLVSPLFSLHLLTFITKNHFTSYLLLSINLYLAPGDDYHWVLFVFFAFVYSHTFCEH